MRFGGAGAPKSWDMDMCGQIGYVCKRCGTCGWGPGTSPGLICSYENGDISVEMDGNMWCAKRRGFINLQESPAGFGPTRHEAIDDLLATEKKGQNQ